MKRLFPNTVRFVMELRQVPRAEAISIVREIRASKRRVIWLPWIVGVVGALLSVVIIALVVVIIATVIDIYDPDGPGEMEWIVKVVGVLVYAAALMLGIWTGGKYRYRMVKRALDGVGR